MIEDTETPGFSKYNMIGNLQADLKNERMHCLFYQQAAAMVEGLHREELRELFLKEAQSELAHIDEFATLIVQLGGVPGTEVSELPVMRSNPKGLVESACLIEKIVASNYAFRLAHLPEWPDMAEAAYVQLFYEDQLMDSQKAAWEFKLLSKKTFD